VLVVVDILEHHLIGTEIQVLFGSESVDLLFHLNIAKLRPGIIKTTIQKPPKNAWNMASSVDPSTRKRVLRVIFISLLLDLVCTAAFAH
jgi:hypothetical protein